MCMHLHVCGYAWSAFGDALPGLYTIAILSSRSFQYSFTPSASSAHAKTCWFGLRPNQLGQSRASPLPFGSEFSLWWVWLYIKDQSNSSQLQHSFYTVSNKLCKGCPQTVWKHADQRGHIFCIQLHIMFQAVDLRSEVNTLCRLTASSSPHREDTGFTDPPTNYWM